MTKDERRDFRSFLQGFFLGCPFTYALTRDDSRQTSWPMPLIGS